MTRLHLPASVVSSLLSGLVAVSFAGCLDRGGLDPNDGGGSGGKGKSDAGMETGGSDPGTGGVTSGTGGATSGTGGATSGTGGVTGGTGGNPGSGGRASTGGAPGTGGRASTGGTPGTGGRASTGGTRGTGGSMGTGGKTMCGPVCDIFCAYGNVLDANGCPTCQCKPGPTCPPLDCPLAPCSYGYVKDEKGCDICKCNPKPCTPEECGPAPTRAEIVICATGTAADPGGGAAPQPPTDAPGIVAAPFVCQRSADGKCSWFSGGCRVCPAVTCTLACMNGFQVGADGCQICACKPPPPTSVCGGLGDPMTCAAKTDCTWLAPGCTEPALAAAGCYAKSSLGCTSDAQCGAGHQCLKRVVNPCYNSQCTACGLTQTICQ